MSTGVRVGIQGLNAPSVDIPWASSWKVTHLKDLLVYDSNQKLVAEFANSEWRYISYLTQTNG